MAKLILYAALLAGLYLAASNASPNNSGDPPPSCPPTQTCR